MGRGKCHKDYGCRFEMIHCYRQRKQSNIYCGGGEMGKGTMAKSGKDSPNNVALIVKESENEIYQLY